MLIADRSRRDPTRFIVQPVEATSMNRRRPRPGGICSYNLQRARHDERHRMVMHNQAPGRASRVKLSDEDMQASNTSGQSTTRLAYWHLDCGMITQTIRG
jgi:hypothetical protein